MKKIIFILLFCSNLNAVNWNNIFGRKKLKMDEFTEASLSCRSNKVIYDLFFSLFTGDDLKEDLQALESLRLVNKAFKDNVEFVASEIDRLCSLEEDLCLSDIYRKILARVVLKNQELIGKLQIFFGKGFNCDLKKQLCLIRETIKNCEETGVFFKMFCPDYYEELSDILLAAGVSPNNKFVKDLKVFINGRLDEEPRLS